MELPDEFGRPEPVDKIKATCDRLFSEWISLDEQNDHITDVFEFANNFLQTNETPISDLTTLAKKCLHDRSLMEAIVEKFEHFIDPL